MTNLAEVNHQLEDTTSFTGRCFEGLVPEDKEILQITSLGEGLTMEHERRVDFTEELASKILEMVEFPGERLLRDQHVSYLINCMKRGTFLPEMVRLTTCVCDEKVEDLPAGTEYRMNGQHTCWARLQMPKDYEFPGKVSMVKYRAKTMQDMRLLYASIDRGAVRTRSNVVAAHLVGTDQFKGLAPTVIRIMSEGYGFYKWPSAHERQKHDGDDIAFLMQSEDANLVNALVAYLSTFSLATIIWLRRSSVVGAMFTTFNKSVKMSGEFWDAVREGVGFTNKDDPRLKLRNVLMTCRIGGKGSVGRGQHSKLATSEEVLRWSIHAWNAWRRDESLTLLKAIMSAERPKAK